MSIVGFADILASKIIPILWKQCIALARIFPVFYAAGIAPRVCALLAAEAVPEAPSGLCLFG
jgi:hypothetical protein